MAEVFLPKVPAKLIQNFLNDYYHLPREKETILERMTDYDPVLRAQFTYSNYDERGTSFYIDGVAMTYGLLTQAAGRLDTRLPKIDSNIADRFLVMLAKDWYGLKGAILDDLIEINEDLLTLVHRYKCDKTKRCFLEGMLAVYGLLEMQAGADSGIGPN